MSEIQTNLVKIIVTASASDGNMTDAELKRMTAMVENLPVFAGMSGEAVRTASDACMELLVEDDGVDKIIAAAAEALPGRLTETAYAVACDVAAADGKAEFEELEFLGMLRDGLNLDRLTAAAIERGARARLARL